MSRTRWKSPKRTQKSSKKTFQKTFQKFEKTFVAFVILIRLIKNVRIMVLLNTIYDNGCEQDAFIFKVF